MLPFQPNSLYISTGKCICPVCLIPVSIFTHFNFFISLLGFGNVSIVWYFSFLKMMSIYKEHGTHYGQRTNICVFILWKRNKLFDDLQNTYNNTHFTFIAVYCVNLLFIRFLCAIWLNCLSHAVIQSIVFSLFNEC